MDECEKRARPTPTYYATGNP
jgi:hypothetical protein